MKNALTTSLVKMHVVFSHVNNS